MTAYAERGDRIRALAHYQQFCRLLDRELGVVPEAATVELFERLASRGIGSALDGAERAETPAGVGEMSSRPAGVGESISGPAGAGESISGSAGAGESTSQSSAAESQSRPTGAGESMSQPPVAAEFPVSPSVPVPLGLTGRRRGAGDRIPFVGREGLVDRILDVLRSGGDGQPVFVLVHGSAGIGKSRLVDELLAAMCRDAEFHEGDAGSAPAEAADPRARRVGAVVLGRCSPYGEDLPYGPLIEGISRIIESVKPGDLNLSDTVWRDLAQIVPEIRERVPAAAGEVVPAPHVHERLRLFQVISRFLRALPRPVAVIVEDLHWADTETLAALAYLVRTPPDGKGGVAVIATTRSAELSPEFVEFAAQAEREGNWLRVDLGPLSADESRDLLAAAWEGASPEVAERIQAEASGNPLYLLEIARYLRDGGTLSREEPGPDPEDAFPVPPAVGRAVAGRMAGLDERARRLLQTASIFPGGVELEPLARTAGLTEDEALSAYETLAAADFFRQDRGRGVHFVHDIVRRAVACTLSAPRRTAIHRRAYDVLAQAAVAAGAPAPAEDLAFHALAGELWREAVHWGQEAARAAERLFAYAAAWRQLDRTLSALAWLPPGGERAETERRVRAWRLRLEYWFNPHQVESQFNESLDRSEADQGENGEELPDVLLARAEVLFMQGKVDAAEPMLERVLALAGEADAVIRGYALGGMGAVHIIRGNFREAIELLLQAKPLIESGGRRFPGQSVTLATASASALKGEFDGFARCMADLEEMPGDLSHLANLIGNKALVAFLQGRYREAVEEARTGMEHARAADHRYNEYFCSIWLAAARVELDEVEGALADLDNCFELAARANTTVLVDLVRAFKAMALLKLGMPANAARVARAGLQLAEENGYKLGGAMCMEALGHIAMAEGDFEGAARWLAEALGRLQAIDARPFVELAVRRIPPDLAGTLPVFRRR